MKVYNKHIVSSISLAFSLALVDLFAQQLQKCIYVYIVCVHRNEFSFIKVYYIYIFHSTVSLSSSFSLWYRVAKRHRMP